MFLVTAGAVLVGALILVVIAANALLATPTDLVAPAEPAPVALAHDRTLGDANAPVTLDEWEDFQCPFCDEYTKTVEPRLVSQYVQSGVLKIVYHDFAFIGSQNDPNNFESLQAAVAARCAGDQGRFWSYMEYLFANQAGENSGTFNKGLFDKIANALKLDQAKFDQCLTDPAKKSDVLAETNKGRQVFAAAGLQEGTPTFFVNGKNVKFAQFTEVYQALSAAIEAAKTGGSASPAASGGPGASPAAAASGGPGASPAASGSPGA